MIKEIHFDARELIKGLQTAFAPVARNHHGQLDEKATFRNVQVLQGRGKQEGNLKVSFFVEGNFRVEFIVEVATLLENYQAYIEGCMEDLSYALLDAKEKRREEKPIILLN